MSSQTKTKEEPRGQIPKSRPAQPNFNFKLIIFSPANALNDYIDSSWRRNNLSENICAALAPLSVEIIKASINDSVVAFGADIRKIRREQCESTLLFLSPRILGRTPVRMAINLLQLNHLKFKKTALFIWDLEWPHDLLAAYVMGALMDGLVIDGANSASQAKELLGSKVRVAHVPTTFFWSKERFATSKKQFVSFDKREYDVFLPSNLYKGRVHLLEGVKESLQLDPMVRFHDSFVEDDDQYQSLLAQSRIVINTANAWKPLTFFLRLAKPRSRFNSWTRLTEKFADGVAHGCLLIQQRTPAIAPFFIEDEHYLGFDSADEALDKLHFALNPLNRGRIKRIAAMSRLRFEQMINSNLLSKIIAQELIRSN